MEQVDRHVLTVVESPAGWSMDRLGELISGTGVIDRETLRLRGVRQPPCVVAVCGVEMGRMAVDAVVREGGDAICPSEDAIAGLGETKKIKHLEVQPGVLVGELWRGGGFGVALDDVQVLVRGDVRTQVKRSAVQDADIGSFGAGVGGMYSVDSMVTHAVHEAMDGGHRGKSSVGVSAKLDIHTGVGSVYQIDGDKFAYAALGEMRTQGDVQNMDLMLDLLSHVCGNAVVDRMFGGFRAPPQLGRFRIEGMPFNKDDPGFAFYSRWIATVYRHVAGWGIGR